MGIDFVISGEDTNCFRIISCDPTVITSGCDNAHSILDQDFSNAAFSNLKPSHALLFYINWTSQSLSSGL